MATPPNAEDLHSRVEQCRADRAGGRLDTAIETLSALARARPESLVFRELGDALAEAGRIAEARAAFARAAGADPYRAAMGEGVAAMRAGRVNEARARLEAIQAEDPTHVYSQLALASLALERRDFGEALRALEPAVGRYPHFEPVQRTLARIHFERSDYAAAERAAQALTRIAPDRADSWLALADVQMAAFRPEAARESFERGLGLDPRQPRARMGLGHALKALGEAELSANAYREAVALEPRLGEAWWSLADLKTYRFSDDEIAVMRARAADPSVGPYDRAGLHYALGKAAEDRGDVDAAFQKYARGAAIRAQLEPFDAAGFERTCQAARSALPTLPARAPQADAGPAPIFIIGLPRSGSTLVEQILASHSKVTASGELPHWPAYAQELSAGRGYGAALRALDAQGFAALGARYRAETGPYQGDGEFYIDKTPNNFLHAGLIARACPDAVFIDVRRDPRDWAWSAFRQNFGRGQNFSYDLKAMAEYYRSYRALIDHWRETSPGRIHQLSYEALVADPEREIRALLDACGLEFEPACLDFHKTRRAVNTPSAEQVRQPIFSRGVGQWRTVERHLAPFTDALGEAH